MCGKGIITSASTREARVSGPASGDPKKISYPKQVLIQYIPTRAKPPVNREPPNRKSEGVSASVGREARLSQKGNLIRRAWRAGNTPLENRALFTQFTPVSARV